ncbi:hypothetical protein BGZ99_000213 [Dissophora globulifera]|uniref:Tail specific protease domain-containing protein n=1 Tax=Dissophora globulifera TaxID=979702 RepID=A0A9P6R5P5_9FUNG|nr:hypothetical protein BGZ99_000213 [Dissophora globulifera]
MSTPLTYRAEGSIDYCMLAARASKQSHGVVPYRLAKGCYEMFPFSAQIRDDTVQNVRANLESFYVFYDIAKSPPHMENSDLAPLDLSASLNLIGNTSFSNDYRFHNKLGSLIAQLRDPHTTYKSMCYQQFVFIQPMSTYGVYEDGRQQVKVATVLNTFDSRLTNALVDCEVTHIDGKPAFDVITEYVKSKAYSKDRGVRINKAFSYLGHDKTGSPYDRYTLGTFAQRTAIPSNSTIEYKIDCQAKIEAVSSSVRAKTAKPSFKTTLELAWSAMDATMSPFTDAASYHKQFCSSGSTQIVKKFILDSAKADDFDAVTIPNLSRNRKKSVELFRGPYASFHLLSDGVTGVFRLGTESPDKSQPVQERGNGVKAGKDGGSDYPSFYENIDEGFAALENAGAEKLIIDLQNNAGGIICWGRYVLQTLFPATVASPYIYSLLASPLAQALAKATFQYDEDVESPYEGLVDPQTGEEVTSESWIVPGQKLPGREGLFSSQVTDRHCPAVEDIKQSADEAPFRAKDIVLLTNGYCGSTCAVLALQLHERYGVRTVAIGGEHGQSMMFSSFPGGAVQANNTLWVQHVREVFEVLPQKARTAELEAMVPKQLPANGRLAFTFRQVMSASEPDKVSEYRRIESEFRMDYTVARFRMPTVLWEDVRDTVWRKADEADSEEEEVDEDGGKDEEEKETEEVLGSEGEDGEGYFIGTQNSKMVAVVEGATEEPDLEDVVWLQG